MPIDVPYGATVEATCRFTYSGAPGAFTLAQEIGTIVTGAPLPESTWIFNTLDRWEVPAQVAAGANTKIFTFVVVKVGGLNPNTTYDMNFEIGTGSKNAGNWQLIKRVFVNDIVRILELSAVFSNLAVSYRKL